MNHPCSKFFGWLCLLSLSLSLSLSLQLKAQQPPTVSNWTFPNPITGQPDTPYGNLTDAHGVRGMYVDEFLPPFNNESKLSNKAGLYDEFRVDFYSGILGNQEKEDRLIWYAKQHGINYLALYQTDIIFRFSDVPDSTYVYDPVREFYQDALNKFLLKCHLAGIEVGLVFEPKFLEWEKNVPLSKNEYQNKHPNEGNTRAKTFKSGAGETNDPLFAHSQYFSPVSSFVWYSNRDSIPKEIAQGAILQGVSSGDYFLEVTYENGCKERTYVNVSKADEINQLVDNGNSEVEVVTWIDENKQGSNLNVFPNPTTEILHVKTITKVDQATILIVNSLGQLIHKQAVDQTQFGNIIDVRSLSPGVYQVVWSSSQGSSSKSFIKQ